MELNFKNRIFRFVRSFVDLTDYLEKIINSDETEAEILIEKANKKLIYKKLKDKIEIIFEDKNFDLYKEPIVFINEKNENLFKIYNDSDLIYKKQILEQINDEYDFYLPNKDKITFNDVGKAGEKTIKLKKKINEYENIFKPLCTRLSTEDKNLTINTNCLLPDGSQSLFIEPNSEFKLIIGNRIDLINKIVDFMENNKKLILKIYGSDGIGKSVTFLYFMSIKTDYKIIYFNLKDIYKYKSDKIQYFKNALLKYFSADSHSEFIVGEDKETDENMFQYNYDLYLNCINDIKKDLTDDFWKILDHFCQYIKYCNNSIIIIDQYKDEYDSEKELYKLIKRIYSGNKQNIKFIISSSLNDNSVKEDLIVDLKYIFRDDIKIKDILNISKENTNNTIDTIDELFQNFEFENNNNEKNYNEDFSNISLFNAPLNYSEDIEMKNNIGDISTNKYEDKLISNLHLHESDKKIIECTEIIYINNLISVEGFFEDNSEEKELYKLFNFNPKTFTKFGNFLNPHSTLLKKDQYFYFLNSIFNGIKKKVEVFYKILEQRIKGYTQERLKGSNLVKLYEIIKNKKQLDLKELIEYLEVFPFKYIKIYLSENSQKDNIIFLNKELNEKKFILDYSYEFIEIAFAKIIDIISPSTVINMKDLSGSGIGSLLENKIKRIIVNSGYVLRYLWDFSSENVKEKEKKYIYDFNKYRKIELEYDDIKKNKIVDKNINYYILPGSETNKSLDSVILQPYGLESFNIIFLQITKFKKKIKRKNDYIKDCIKAKKKIESIYEIKINQMYFYFVLAEDFDNEDTKIDLELNNISYFYYSIKQESFTKDGKVKIYLDKLNDNEAEIFSDNETNEYQNFESKLASINLIEKYLQKKRRINNDIKINEGHYISAQKYLLKKTPNIGLDYENKKEMIKIVKKSKTKYSYKSITFQFAFCINLYEFYKFEKFEDLIGLLVYKKNKGKKKFFSYFYNGVIYQKGDDLSIKYFCHDKNVPRKVINFMNNYLVNEIPEIYMNLIYVFKIYSLNK